MATRLQRTKAVLDALKDGDAPNATIGRVLDAYGFTYARGEDLTNDQKAAVFLRALKIQIRQIVSDSVRSQAAAAAANAADDAVDIGADE